MERDAEVEENTYIHMDFNSHAHVERDIRKKYPMQPFTNFNSHAHVERDFEFFDNEMYIPKISTHTLTWSVTG